MSLIVLPLCAGAAFAAPKAARGTQSYCADTDTVYEGVWRDGNGQEQLLFRVGLSGTDGCYAWLNPVSAWDIPEAGMVRAKARTRNGAIVLKLDGDRQVILKPGGVAEFLIGNFVTPGEHRQVR